MKKILIVFASIIVILLAAAFILPVVFKDDIKVAVDKALAESVNADIVWDVDDFSISLFKNFPNATASLNNFGVINRAPFDNQILFAVEQFEVEIDIFSLLGDQIKIKGVELNHPEVFIKVLEDGTANYDIAISDDTAAQVESDTVATNYNIGIDHWQIINGHVVYDDASLPFTMEIENLNHSGSGDFTQDEFDLTTHTQADSVTVNFDGTEYITNKKVEIDAVLRISDEYSKYTFQDNFAKINDFAMSFDGYLALLDDGSMDMNLTYGTKENTFKSLLSLVPGIYTESFNNIETDGTLSFSGAVKGKYDSLTLPAFNLQLAVNDAMFKYPDLPTAIENISLDLAVDNEDGNIDNTVVNLKNMHLDFGQNPVDAKLLLKNLYNYNMDAELKAKLNLKELSSMFPLDGMAVSGLFNVELTASGVYDSVKNIMPKISTSMNMEKGYIKTSEFPYALENLSFGAKVEDATGKMSDFHAVVNNFKMVMDGEPFEADLTLNNLENYSWDVSAKGGVDLKKITQVFPLEGMELAGQIKADLKTKGIMSDLEAEKYDKLPTSGKVTVQNFSYKDAELPYDVTISSADLAFDPKNVTINNYKGTVGKSDMEITGSVSNYIGYMFGDNEILKGTMNFNSNLLDLNEFMSEEEEPTTTTTTEEESYGVIQVPENIDFILKSSIKTVNVMDMAITNAKGDIVVKNGIANLSGLTFNLLEGGFVVNGSYDARDIEKPKYDFKLDVSSLSIQKAFKTFNVVKTFAPIAEKVNGNVSTDFNISGLLDQSMMPDMGTVTANGLLNILQASINNSKIIKGITSLTKLNDTDQVTMKNVLMKVKIEDGQLKVEPFDVKVGDYTTSITGATALDGGINYSLKMDVPAGKVGTQLNGLLAQYGASTNSGSTIPVKLGIGGTYDDPKVNLLMSDQKEQVKDAAKEKAKEEVKDAAKEALNNVKDEKAKEVIDNILNKDGENKETPTKEEVVDQVKEEAKDKIKDLFNKKKD